MTNKSQYILQSSKIILNQAKKIFGDLVIEAFVERPYYPHAETISEAFEKTKILTKNIEEYQTSEELYYDDNTVHLTFINNKTVMFSAGEWGAINPRDYEKSEYIISE